MCPTIIINILRLVHLTKMQKVNMILGKKSRVYLLIDTVLSVRFDLPRKKRRVPHNLGQQWPVRLSPIPQKIKEANVRQCIELPPRKKTGLSVRCGCHGECRSCWTCQLCIAPSLQTSSPSSAVLQGCNIRRRVGKEIPVTYCWQGWLVAREGKVVSPSLFGALE